MKQLEPKSKLTGALIMAALLNFGGKTANVRQKRVRAMPSAKLAILESIIPADQRRSLNFSPTTPSVL